MMNEKIENDPSITGKSPVHRAESRNCFKNRFEEFFRSVQVVYSKSYVCGNSCISIKSGGKNVIRGRARCIAGRVEDLFAMALYDVLKYRIPDLYVFVDLPLSFASKDSTGKKNSGICYPDIVVAKKEDGGMEILYLVEVKVNLGWGRSKLAGEEKGKDKKIHKVTPIEEDLASELDNLIDTRVWSKTPLDLVEHKDGKRGKRGGELAFTVSADAKYDIIICSSKNVPNDALEKARSRIGEDINAVCQLFVLSDKELSPKYASEKEKRERQTLCAGDVGKFEQRIEAIFPRERFDDNKCQSMYGHESAEV